MDKDKFSEVDIEDEKKIEDNLCDEEEASIPNPYSILSYGTDFPVDGLVKRLQNNSIKIPSFQRDYVWNFTKASKFIESLLLGLPVPGIFLSREQDTKQLIVIDGQQRLKTLKYFYEGFFKDTERVFSLKGVHKLYEGFTYKKLSVEDKIRLDDSIIHATIVQQEKPPIDDSSIYYIFERLNTGGVFLQPQEIRSSIYHGPFNDLIRKLNNENIAWRNIYGALSPRMRDQELILRFLALFLDFANYKKPMKEFLNLFMKKNKNLENLKSDFLSDLFNTTINTIYSSLENNAFKPTKALNAAVFDSVMVGIANRIQKGKINNLEILKEKYFLLFSDEEYMSSVLDSTSDEEKIRYRLNSSITIFKSI